MSRIVSMLLMATVAVGGWFFFKHFDVEGLDRVRVRSTSGARGTSTGDVRSDETIRVASFNLHVYGTRKASKAPVMAILAEIVRRFDVVAVQEIRSLDQQVVPRLIEAVNADGRRYDFVIGERLGHTSSKEQFAYLYDTETLEVDFEGTYTVADPDGLLHRAPLVAAFRVRGPPADEAFTFSLVNVHTDPDLTETELNVMDNVYRAVRSDGRAEDDIILLGDFNVDTRNLGELGRVPEITWVLSGVPTNTRGTHAYDNILLHRRATVEYTGRSGVLDVLREFNLTQDQALDVSDHLPVWAEFSKLEGDRGGRIATRPEAGKTR